MTIKMKSISFFVAVLALAQGQEMFMSGHGIPPAGPPDARAASPIWRNITQRQDHFDPSNQNTWQMRYIRNNQFSHFGGHIFVFLGGEWDIGSGWLQGGYMYEMAQTHRAYMYYTEHRYYGESQPTADQSVANLKYLTTDQALEDIAQVIIQIRKDVFDPNAKVVVFGGSYAGNLAIWMRLKYPHLVHAAVSSSGPVLAQVDFHEYHDVVQRSLGTECAAVINKGMTEIQRLLSVGEVAKVKRDLNWCWSLNIANRFEIEAFFRTLASHFGAKLQNGSPAIISQICTPLLNSTLMTDYERLTAYLKRPSCKLNYKSLLVNTTNSALYGDNGLMWKYQACNEFGYFQTSWTATSLYGRTISTDLFQKSCMDSFGPTLTAAVTAAGAAATNAKFGGLNPDVTRVVSVHGIFDPWSGLGLKTDLNPEAPVIIVEGVGHCSDMSGLNSNDPPALNDAKLAVRRYIADWLQQS